MSRLLARLLLVLLVLLSSGAMPVPARGGKARSCCALKSSCDRMSSKGGEKSCCRLPEAAANDDAAPLPANACLLAAAGCGPAAVTAPSAPVVFPFVVPVAPRSQQPQVMSFAHAVLADPVSDASRDVRPRPPQPTSAPGSRA